jgi:ABC-type antimicrobial peptide transport system permease subunit
MILIGIGLAIGLAAIIGATHFMASLLCGITANGPWTLAVTAAIFALLAIVAGFLPALRASRLDPMDALCEE